MLQSIKILAYDVKKQQMVYCSKAHNFNNPFYYFSLKTYDFLFIGVSSL